MSFGKIEYNEEGLPMCEECGLFFHRVTTHVRHAHEMTARDYKIKHGLDISKGICSKESSDLARQRVFDNYDQCIGKNLLKAGKKTRLKKGSSGRPRDKISAQTMADLKTTLIVNVHMKNLEVLVEKEIKKESKPNPK